MRRALAPRVSSCSSRSSSLGIGSVLVGIAEFLLQSGNNPRIYAGHVNFMEMLDAFTPVVYKTFEDWFYRKLSPQTMEKCVEKANEKGVVVS